MNRLVVLFFIIGCGDDYSEVKHYYIKTCTGQYSNYNSGPILDDGCYACNVSCYSLTCRDYNEKETSGIGSVDFPLSIRYIYYCAKHNDEYQYISLTYQQSYVDLCWNKPTIEAYLNQCEWDTK